MYWESDLEGLQSIHITGKDIEFSLIEDQTIDIDSIEEYQIPAHVPITALEEKLIDLINEDRKAIKHLNKEMQSIKERK